MGVSIIALLTVNIPKISHTSFLALRATAVMTTKIDISYRLSMVLGINSPDFLLMETLFVGTLFM
jgi:hypothetical protein